MGQPGSAASAAEQRRKRLTVAIVALGALMTSLDATIVNVALPDIRSDLGYLQVSVSDLQWVVNAYALTYASALLTAGKLGDIFGRRRVFLLGLVVFTASSIGCGAAGNIDVLIGLRAVQGVGAAMITPCSLSILTATFAPEERGLAMGLWSGVLGVGVALGPLVGGILVEELSWRWVFFVNVPIGIACAAATLTWVKESRAPTQDRNLDLPGVAVSSLGLFALTFGLLKGNDFGWTDPRTLILLAIGVGGLLLFVRVERTRTAPMLPLTLFRSATFTGANIVAIFAGFILFGQLFLGSLLLQTVMGYSALETGLALLPLTLLIMVVSPPVGWLLSNGVGPRWLITAGMIMLANSLVLFSRLGFKSTFWDVLPSLALAGLGFGLVLTAVTTAALIGVPVRYAGIGSGIINTTRQVGGTIGLAIVVAVQTAALNSWLSDGHSRPDSFVHGFQIAMLVAAGVAAAGAVVAALTLAREAPAAAEAMAPDQLDLKPAASWAVAAPSVVRPLARAAPRVRAGLQFQVVSGPATGMQISYPPAPFLIGRAAEGPGNLMRDPELSREHARLCPEPDGRPLIEDLGSTNGTFVNGNAITEPVVLSVGDTIRLGSSELAVVAAPAGEPRSLGAAHSRLHEKRTRMSLASPPATAATGGFVLRVEEGKAAGKRIPVPEELIVGRAEHGDGRLDGDPELSRRHASFSVFDPGRVLVEDLGSTNGTFVNGHRIHAPTIVTPGDEIHVGSTTIDVEPTTSPPPPATAEPPVAAGEPS